MVDPNLDTLRLGVIGTPNEPVGGEAGASGIVWAPELDTFRINTVSGMRELRTGHGIIEVVRNVDATALTFTTTFTSCVYNLGATIIDDDYYELDGAQEVITVKEEGIYRVSYANNIDISGETQARSGSESQILVNGSVVNAESFSYGYHRLASVGKDTGSKSYLRTFSAGDTVECQARRYSGGDTLRFITGCELCIERIGPLRNASVGQ